MALRGTQLRDRRADRRNQTVGLVAPVESAVRWRHFPVSQLSRKFCGRRPPTCHTSSSRTSVVASSTVEASQTAYPMTPATSEGGSLVVDEQSAEWVGRSALALLPRRFPDQWSVESRMVRRLTRRLRTINEAAPAAVLCPESLSARSSSLCTARFERKKIVGPGAQRWLGGNF